MLFLINRYLLHIKTVKLRFAQFTIKESNLGETKLQQSRKQLSISRGAYPAMFHMTKKAKVQDWNKILKGGQEI